MYGSSKVYRSRLDILGRFAHSPARMFSDAVPCKGLNDGMNSMLSLVNKL